MPRQELLIDVGLDTAKLRNQALESKQELLKLMKDMKIEPEVNWGDSLQKMIEQLTAIIDTLNGYSPNGMESWGESFKSIISNVTEIQSVIDALKNDTNFQGKIDGIVSGFERTKEIISELVSEAYQLDKALGDEKTNFDEKEKEAEELKEKLKELSDASQGAFNQEQAEIFLKILSEIKTEIEQLRSALIEASNMSNSFFNVQKIELLSKSVETMQNVISQLSFGDQLIPEIQRIQDSINELRESISNIKDVNLSLNLGGNRNSIAQNKEWGYVAKNALKDIRAQYKALVSEFNQQDLMYLFRNKFSSALNPDKHWLTEFMYGDFLDEKTPLIDQVQTYKDNLALLREMSKEFTDADSLIEPFNRAEAAIDETLRKHAQIYEFSTEQHGNPLSNIFGNFDSTKITEQLDQIIVKLDEFNAALQNTIRVGGALDLSGLNNLVNTISGSFSSEGTATTIQSEANLFSSLNGAINTVSDSIARKNRAINNEGTIAEDTVNKEISLFQQLDAAISHPVQGETLTQDSLNSLLQSHKEIIKSTTDAESLLFDSVIQKVGLLNSKISTGIGDLSSALTKLQSLGIVNVKAPVIDEGVEARIKQIRQPLDSLSGSGLTNNYTAKLQSSISDINKIEESYRKGTITLKEFTNAVNSAVKSLEKEAEAEKAAAEAAAESRGKAAKEAAEAKAKADEAAAAAKEQADKDAAKAEKDRRDAAYDEYKTTRTQYKAAYKEYENAKFSAKDNSAGLAEMQKNVEALKARLEDAKNRLLGLHPTEEQLNAFQELAQYESDIRDSAHAKAVAKWGSTTDINANSTANLEETIRQAESLRKISDIKIEPKFESDAIKQFAVSGKNARGEIESMTYTVDKATGEVYRLSNASRQAAQSTMTMGNFFAKAANYLVRYFGMYMSAHRLFSEIRNGVGYVKELDTAMTEFQVVTKETDETLNKFADDAYEVANTVASTTADVVKSSTEWARLGYSMEDSLTLASQSAKLAKTGFMEVSESTEQLTAGIQAFYGADLKSGIVSAGEAATHVSDELVALGNQMPITSQGLGAALERSAGSLVAAGNTIEESVALLAAANATIQNPESVGTGFKTVAMRLRGTKVTDLANDSDIDVEGMATSASKLYDKIKKLTAVKSNDFQGISILTDTGAYKSTFQILSEIADVWKEINDVNQAALLEEIAGKRQAAAIGAIMNNPELLKQGKQYADEAAGATDEAMEIAMDSIESRLAQLKNNWQAFWQDLISSDMAKDLIGMINGLVEALDRLIKLGGKFGSLTPLIGLLTGVGFGFHQIRTQDPMFGILGVGSAIGKAWKNRKFDASGLLSSETENIMNTAEFQKAGDKQKFLKERLGDVQKQIGMTDDAMEKYTVSVVKNGEETGEAAKGAVKAGSGFKNFALGLLNTIGTMIAVSAALAALNWAWKKFDENVIHKYDTAIKNGKDFLDSQKEIAKAAEDNIKAIDGYSDRFTELSKGVDQYGNNVSLTAKEFDEYKSIVSEIVEMSPKLAKGYDVENGYLVNKVDLLKQAKKAQEDEYKATLRTRTNVNSGASDEIGAAGAIYAQARDKYNQKTRVYTYGYDNTHGSAQNYIDSEAMNYLNQYSLVKSPEITTVENTEKTVHGLLTSLYEASTLYQESQQDLAHYIADTQNIMLGDDYDYSNFFDDYEDEVADFADHMADSFESAGMGAEEFEKLKSDLGEAVDGYQEYCDAVDESNRMIHDNLNAVAQLSPMYSALNGEYRNLVASYIKSFDVQDGDIINPDGSINNTKYLEAERKIRSLISSLATDSGIRERLKALSDGNVLAADYDSEVASIVKYIQSKLPDGVDLTDSEIKLGLNLTPTDENGKELNAETMKEFIEAHLESGSINTMTISMGKLKTMYDVVVELKDEGNGDKFSQQYIEKVAEYTVQKNRIENVSHTAFTDAKASVEAYTKALSSLQPYISNNVTISEEEYKAIRAVVGAEADLSEILVDGGQDAEGNTQYLLKNNEALNKLLKSNSKAVGTLKKVADGQDQARKRYAELTQEIYKTITATDKFDRETINALYDEAQAVQDLIDDYARLEQQVLGNTKAFDDFNSAKTADETKKYDSEMVEMYNTVNSAYKTGIGYGTDAYGVAVRSILPEGWEGDINDFESVITAAEDHIRELAKAGMLSFDENGVKALDLNNINAFLKAADEVEAIDLKEDGSFEVLASDVQEFAKMMHMSVTEVNGYIEAESKADKLGRNMWEQLFGNDINYQLHQANQELMSALTELDNAYLSGDQAQVDAALKLVEDAKANVNEQANVAVGNMDLIIQYLGKEDELQQAIIDTYNKIGQLDLAGGIIDVFEEYSEGMNLLKEFEEKGLDTTKTVFGNVDLNDADRKITWTTELVDQYRDALISLGYEEEHLGDFVGSVSTVMGASSEYGGFEVAYTPMLKTDNGMTVLDQSTIDEYIFSLFDIANADGNFDLSEIYELDKGNGEFQYFLEDGTQVKNLIADIGETAQLTGEAMHYLGDNGALALDKDLLIKYAEENGLTFDQLLNLAGNNSEARAELQAQLEEYLSAYKGMNLPIGLQLTMSKEQLEEELAKAQQDLVTMKSSGLATPDDIDAAEKKIAETQEKINNIATYLGEDQEELAKIFDIPNITDADNLIDGIKENALTINGIKGIELFDDENLRTANALLDNIVGDLEVKPKTLSDAQKEAATELANQMESQAVVNDLEKEAAKLAESRASASSQYNSDQEELLKQQQELERQQKEREKQQQETYNSARSYLQEQHKAFEQQRYDDVQSRYSEFDSNYNAVTSFGSLPTDEVSQMLADAQGIREEMEAIGEDNFDRSMVDAIDARITLLESVIAINERMAKEANSAITDQALAVKEANDTISTSLSNAYNVDGLIDLFNQMGSDDFDPLNVQDLSVEEFASLVNDFKEAVNSELPTVLNELDTDEERQELQSWIDDVFNTLDAMVDVSVTGDAETKLPKLNTELQNLRDNNVVTVYFHGNANGITTTIDNIITRLSTLKGSSTGGESNAYGTFGNSFAGGIRNDLVGELGRELIVDPHSGRYYTVGDNGAEMIDLPKDAIVFNHQQTEDLLRHGHTSRGRSFVTGNAYSGAVAGNKTTTKGSGRNLWDSASSASATKAAAEEAAKDWVEAFKKAQEKLEKQYKAGEIDFEEYLDKMTALYQKYYDQYGSKSKENMEKLHSAWVEMYNGTQSALDSQYSDGEISLRQYLNNLQSLYQRFYSNTEEYAKERAEAEKNYIKQMKSGYESLFSAANTVIQHQINDLERQKKAADKAYDAQIKAIQNQIDHYEDLIDGIEKQKKAIQKEIDAIRDSNEERQRAIDLQKAQYELARAQNQRTQYIYTSDKGFVYRSNPTEEREKREELDNQRTEKRIAELQKEIDKLDETIEKYQDQIDIWNKQIEAIEKMKEATDKYFDDLIEKLQLQQEKWSEFQEMMELAQAISVLESFGLTVQDVLNGTGEGMERIKEGFLTVLATINKGNEEGLTGLSQAFGKSVEEVQGMISDADSMALGMNGLIISLVQNAAGAADPVDAVADSVSKLTGSAKDTAGLKDVADTMSKISGTDATGLTDSLTTLSQNAGQFTALNAELTQLLDTINNLGQNTTFASNGELLAQFQAFCQNFMLQAQTFKDNVTALFGGGGGVAAGAGAEGGGAGGASGGWFDSFVAQVEDLNMRTQGPMAELTAQWQTLKDTIQSIIGSYDEEGGGEEDDSSILGNFAIGSEGLLLALQEWTDSLLNFQSEGIAPVASSITDIINSMADAVIAACSRAAAAINALRGQAVEANIAVTGGGVADGTAHALGTAFVNGSGNWGLRGNERGALVGELGPEAVVRDGKYSILGQNGAEFTNLRRGDIVFNHKQTEQLFKYGKITGRGRAFASGSFPSIDGFKPMASALWEKMTNALSSISDNLQRIAPEVQRTGLAFAGAGGGMSSDDHSFVIQNMNIDMPNFNSDKADDLIKDLNTLAIKAVQRYHR